MKKFVVGILCKDNKYLAEERHQYEKYFPGKIIFPGGHIEENEEPEAALAREMKEELGVSIESYHFVDEFHYGDGNSSKVYAIGKWKGNPNAKEAKNLVWVEKEDQLSNEYDRNILRKLKSLKK